MVGASDKLNYFQSSQYLPFAQDYFYLLFVQLILEMESFLHSIGHDSIYKTKTLDLI
jgi:hypothetical protein